MEPLRAMMVQMPEPEAAVAIVWSRAAEESVLFMRRSVRENDPWSGQWSFPGGHCDPEDPDALHTALRELREECDIHLTPQHLHKALPPTVARRRVGRYLDVAPFVFGVDDRPTVRVDEKEAMEARWIPLGVLEDPGRHLLRAVPGMPPEMLFPAIDLDPDHVPLWGFTYRLTTEWLGLLPPREEMQAFAEELLEFLVANGLRLESAWTERSAAVRGVIPAPLVVARLGGLHQRIPPVNLVEVRPDLIRMMGLAFEEYQIRAIP
jgi:8-oxo-dGTP pyrophosphatase MutT (NUDIX family)